MNKNIQSLVLVLAISFASFAQVGIGTTSPDASSALDITATDKGFLMPRMTTAQRTAIASPAMGLQVYDTETKSVWTNDGTIWKETTGGGKFVEGDNPSIAAYTDGPVTIGATYASAVHKLYVKNQRSSINSNTAVKIDAIFDGTGISPTTIGLNSTGENIGSGTINYAIGIRGLVGNLAGGTVNAGVGSRPQVNNSGVMGYAGAFVGTVSNNGTMNEVNGMFLEYKGTGTVTDSYAIFIDGSFNKGTAKNYSIYSDSDADSYFNGNIGLGIETPQQKIHIGGAMRLEPQAAAPAGALGDLYVGTDSKLYFHNGTAWKEVQLVP